MTSAIGANEAQQGARANDHIRHVSCWRRSRAGCGRGSSLTLGKTPMVGRKARIPDDMLPFKERLSPEEKKKWIAEWRRLVWHSPRYLALYAFVVIAVILFFVFFMPVWEIADTVGSKLLFGAGELMVVYMLAEWFTYGFSRPVIERRMKDALPKDKNA
jgi:hypothetical protein